MKYIIAMLASSLFGVSLFNEGGIIEASYAPAGKAFNFQLQTREEDRFCFSFDYEKFRDVEPVSLGWQVMADGNKDKTAFVTPYDPGDAKMAVVNQHTMPGKIDHRLRCVEIPRPLRGGDRKLQLGARVEYEAPHHLWRIPVYIGPFDIPPANPKE